MSVSTLHPAAWHAIKAVQVFKMCGRYAAHQYATKNGCLSLYIKARQLAAVEFI